jgi:hypothetical protein
MSVRVTRVPRNSLSRIGMVRSITRNDNEKQIPRLFIQKLSNRSNLKTMRIQPIPFDRYESRTSSQTPICSHFLEMSQISSFHKTKSKHPRLSIPSYDKCYPTSMVNSIYDF